jgi:hypothetical protein
MRTREAGGGKTFKGTCASKEGSPLWCALEKPGGGKPDSRRRAPRRRTGGGGKPGGGPGMPAKELLMKACEGKEEKDACEVSRQISGKLSNLLYDPPPSPCLPKTNTKGAFKLYIWRLQKTDCSTYTIQDMSCSTYPTPSHVHLIHHIPTLPRFKVL